MNREEYFDQLLEMFCEYLEDNGKKEAQLNEDILSFIESNEVPTEDKQLFV